MLTSEGGHPELASMAVLRRLSYTSAAIKVSVGCSLPSKKSKMQSADYVQICSCYSHPMLLDGWLSLGSASTVRDARVLTAGP